MKHVRLASLLLGSLLALSCGTRTTGNKPVCPPTCKTCSDDNQCLDCDPKASTQICKDDVVSACNADGTIGNQIKVCDGSLHYHCDGNDCVSPCDVAAASHSYIGCDYWPTPTLNAQLNPMFDFAVVVANPLTVNEVTTPGPAFVKVVRGSAPCVADATIDDFTIQVTTVEPGAAKVILLPWIDTVSQMGSAEYSTQEADGAYHLCSSLPVTAYQFNPLQFEKQPPAGKQCPDIGNGFPEPPPCHSYTNDASTLLPTSTLGKEYIVSSRATMALARHSNTFPPKPDPPPSMTPGFFTIVGTQDETTITVDYKAFIAAGVNIANHGPGESDTYTINKGDVLQVVSAKPAWKPDLKNLKKPPCVDGFDDFQATYCDLGKDYDLTGTHILADKPIAVFGGHSCSFVPYNKWACDHLEQQMFPLNTWGQHYLAAQTYPSQKDEPNLFRIISGANNNTITFDGGMVMQQVTLNSGEWIEFIATGGFEAKGTDRLLVAQYMVGENYFPNFNQNAVGDPAMGLVVPVEQYRKSYDFLTPQTYTNQFVTVVAQGGTSFTLDDMVIRMPFDNEIGSSGYSFKNDLKLDPGLHHITSDQPFGIAVSGTAAYTSYLFPGGLNLNELTPQ